MITLASVLLACVPQLNDQQTQLINAIIQVESSGKDDAVGDNGKAIGCLQIWKPYWLDATERSNIGGKYSDCFKRGYAVRIFDAYMKRYAGAAWLSRSAFNPEIVARIHNGGPKGYRKTATEKYWKKVKILLDASTPLVYNTHMKYDLIDLPGEIADLPDCGACYDNGYIDDDETVFCDCSAGERENDLMAEVEADMRAEEESERRATDYAYAVDSQYQDPREDW